MQIILYSEDITLLEYWQESLEAVSLSVDSFDSLQGFSDSFILVDFMACKRDTKEFFHRLRAKKNRILVLHSNPDFATAKKMLQEGAMGYGNARMRKHFLRSALETLKENMVWLHPEFTSMLIADIPSSSQEKHEKIAHLTHREQEVALLLAEGKTYNEIAQLLAITPRTIKAHATHIYEKLQLKDRIALALYLK